MLKKSLTLAILAIISCSIIDCSQSYDYEDLYAEYNQIDNLNAPRLVYYANYICSQLTTMIYFYNEQRELNRLHKKAFESLGSEIMIFFREDREHNKHDLRTKYGEISQHSFFMNEDGKEHCPQLKPLYDKANSILGNRDYAKFDGWQMSRTSCGGIRMIR